MITNTKPVSNLVINTVVDKILSIDFRYNVSVHYGESTLCLVDTIVSLHYNKCALW